MCKVAKNGIRLHNDINLLIKQKLLAISKSDGSRNLLCSTLERLLVGGENYAVNTFQAVECHKNRKEKGKERLLFVAGGRRRQTRAAAPVLLPLHPSTPSLARPFPTVTTSHSDTNSTYDSSIGGCCISQQCERRGATAARTRWRQAPCDVGWQIVASEIYVP